MRWILLLLFYSLSFMIFGYVYANPSSTFDQIQSLRKLGEDSAAKKLALNYLANHPDDSDVKLLLGLLYRQEKNFTEAKKHLKPVLQKTPDYLDARIGLINIAIEENHNKDALGLIREGLKLHPGNKQLLTLKKRITKQKLKPRNIHKLVYQPDAIDLRIQAANAYLANYHDMAALLVIERSLKAYPNEPRLLLKKGEIQSILYRHALAATAYQRVLQNDPQNKKAHELLAGINEISPFFLHGLNEIGVKSDNAYVSDLHSIWDYSSVYYSRDTNYGPVTAQINYASRLQKQAPQYEIKLSPRINRHTYFDVMAAFANEPILFPKKVLGVEGFYDMPTFLNLSLGVKYSDIGPTHFSTYTGSLSRYIDNYWVSFRPYYFVPKDSKGSILYTGILRRYFATVDHYISVALGSGRSPDLADLITVNFLVIKNNFINLNYEFPLFNHLFVIDLGAGYQRWEYPSDLVRNLYNGSIGIKYRF